jgi:hypothetical protein
MDTYGFKKLRIPKAMGFICHDVNRFFWGGQVLKIVLAGIKPLGSM